jgi:diguanylate cyclase (GGDEF)-like protein
MKTGHLVTQKLRNIINRQLTLIFITVIFALLVAVGMLVNISYNEKISDYHNNLDNFSERIYAPMSDAIRLMETSSVLIKSGLAENKDYAELSLLLATINKTNTNFENMEIIGDDFKTLASFPQYHYVVGYDRSGEIIYHLPENLPYIQWSNIIFSEFSKQPSLRLLYEVPDVRLLGTLNLGTIQNYCDQLEEENNLVGHIELTDRYGTYICDDKPQMVEEQRINLHFVTHDIKDYDPKIEYLDHQWQLRLYKHIPNLGWHIAIVVPVVKVLSEHLFILISFMSFIIVMSIIFVILSQRNNQVFSSQVDNLVDQTNQISKGIYTYKPAESKYREFLDLASNINTMQSAIMSRDQLLRDIAFRDVLTDSNNRNYLIKVLLPSWLSDIEQPFALEIINIDHFNLINDAFGHDFGDAVLIELSKRLNTIVPAEQLVRLGADEFVLVLKLHDLDLISTVNAIQRIQDQPFIIQNREIFLTFSAGVSIFPKDGTQINDLMMCADIALRHAKKSGIGGMAIYDDVLKQVMNRKLVIEQQLRTAISNNEFYLVFQPQFSIDGQHIRGYEALIRWENSVLGSVMPSEFISVAEHSQMLTGITHWVIANAVEAITAINQQKNSSYSVAVNTSANDYLDTKLTDQIRSLIATTGFNPKWLELEITENIPLGMEDVILQQISMLQSMGVSIAMDDFGSGYSSLAYLSRLSIDLLKIDRSLIFELHQDTDKQAILRAIVAMAKELGINVLAEGVEELQECEMLQAIGCEFAQGYYYAKPVKLKDIFINNLY